AWRRRRSARARPPTNRLSPSNGPLTGLLRHAFRGFLVVVIVHEESVNDVGHAFGGGAIGQVDGDHVGVDVHGVHPAPVEQAAGQLVGGAVPRGLLAGPVALVVHAREAAVQLEADDVGTGTPLLGDGDGLSHGRA